MQMLFRIDESSALEPGASGCENWMHLVRFGQSLTAGRDDSLCDIVIPRDPLLSAAHFHVSSGPDGFRLIDLESRHGTLVNGVRVTEAVLKQGDRIVAGATRFEVVLQEVSIRVNPSVNIRENASIDSGNAGQPVPVTPKSGIRLMLQIFEEPSKARDSAFLNNVFTTILPGEVIIIGRVPERSDLSFPNDYEMSGTHAELSCDRHDCRLRDLNSTNGTYINGEPMYNLLLRNGDELRVGRTQFIVHMRSPESSTVIRATQTLAEHGLRPGLRKQAEFRAESFRIVNTSLFPIVPLTGRIGFPKHSLTLIVKGTFQMRHNECVVPLDEQAFPTGDVPYSDDSDPLWPPRYESDFAFFKPKADILVVGHCYAPDSQPVKRLKAGVQVGTMTKSLLIAGRRSWKKERGTWQTTDPEPFTRLELTYKHSYGGAQCDLNPAGVGFPDPSRRRSDPSIPLPLIETPDEPLRTPDDIVEPAGFGPVGRWYGRRRTQLGVFDKTWENSRWPWFPSDFSWEHYNAAPTSQQVAGFLRGDEDVVLENLHSVHTEYKTKLPGIRIRCFVNPLGREFREVPTQLDTLWIDADKEQLVLVWRGNTDVVSEECRDIRHIFVLSQSLDEEPWSVSECHGRLLHELWRHDSIFKPAAEVPPDEFTENTPESVPAGSPPDVSATAAEEANRKFEIDLARLKAEVRSSQIAAGANPEDFDQQVAAETARMVREWGLEGETPPADLQSRINAELFRLQKQIHATQVAAGLNPEPLRDSPNSDPEEESGELSDWTRESVIEHYSGGKSFAGEIFSRLDFSELDLSGADFRAAVFQEVKFVGCRLCGANFDLANLAGADFTNAVLDDASMNHADLTRANLHNSQLSDISARRAIFAMAWLTNVKMSRADATGACFAETDLTGAVMDSGQFDGSDFAEARLSQADMTNSSFVEASMANAIARNAILDQCNLTKLRAAGADFSSSRFVQVKAADSIFENGCLRSVDFSYASLRGANFIHVNLERATLSAADMSGVRLDKSNLQWAIMTDVKLFEASLQDCDLANSDLTRSNLYGAEVTGVNWDNSCLELVNVKLTTLASQENS